MPDEISGSHASFHLTTDPGQLAAHFEGREFLCRCGCCRLYIARELVDELNRLRAVVEAPVLIDSGYRCPVHNRSQNGSARSLHTLGLAADVHCPSLDANELHQLAGREWLDRLVGGVGYYDSFVHLDVGTVREWDERTG